MNKGKKFFNIIIAITVIALIAVGGYATYYYLSNYWALKDAEDAVEEFESNIVIVNLDDIEEIIEEEQPITEVEQPVQQTKKTGSTGSGTGTTYRGYSMIGTIQIPKTKLKSPIVDKVTPNSISAAVGVLYGPGLNQVGNTVLAAHNYRNRNFLF